MKKITKVRTNQDFLENPPSLISILKTNKKLLVSLITIIVVATGILGFTLGKASNSRDFSTVSEASKTVQIDQDIIEQDLVSLEIEKLDSEKLNATLKEQNTKMAEESKSLSENILGSLMSNLESKTVTNRSANITSFIAEAKNLLVLSNKLEAFKKTADYTLIDLSSYEEALDSRLDHIPTLKPVPGNFSGYGWRIHPIFQYRQFHAAADQGASEGTPIKAAGSGYVVRSSYDSSSGNCIVINHGNGFVTTYMHCSVLLVKVGQQVKKGDIIAKVGSTGTSTGPHLHFAVSYNGSPFNPQQILME